MILNSRHFMAQKKRNKKGRRLEAFLLSMVGGRDIVYWYLLQNIVEKCKD